MSEKKKQEHAAETAVKPYAAWIMKHDLLSTCGLTLALGLIMGGIATVLEWLFV